jgi:DHA2 family multidrug resistance protein
MVRDKLKKLPYKWVVMMVVMIGILMSVLDSSIVNISIPAMMADFGVSIDDIQWVVTAYMLSFAVLMPLTSWFRDRIGYKTLYMLSLSLFTVGSLLCAMAWNLESLIFARIIQAIGGGAISPTAMAMVTEVFEPKERGKAMGMFGLGIIIGPILGPTLGGFLTKFFGWRSIFTINLPIGIIGYFLASALLKKDEQHSMKKVPFDLWGFLFLTLFLVFMLLGISKGQSKGWTSAYIIWCWIVSSTSFVLFCLAESLVEHPVIDFSIFKFPVFNVCMLITAVRSVALFGGIFLIPVFLQQIKGLDEIESGLILIPGALIMAFMLPLAGRLSDKLSPRLLSIVGMVFIAVFMFMYTRIQPHMTTWDIIAPTLIRGIGMSLLMSPVMVTAMNSVPNNKAGTASSLLNIMGQIAGAIGIAVLSTVLHNRTAFHLASLKLATGSVTSTMQHSIQGLVQFYHNAGFSYGSSMIGARSMMSIHIYHIAATQAFQDAFWVGFWMMVVSILPIWLMPKRPLTHGHAGAPSGAAAMAE